MFRLQTEAGAEACGLTDYDAEDLPHWWQRWTAEIIGGVILGACVFAAAVFAYRVMPNPLPGWLEALTRLV